MAVYLDVLPRLGLTEAESAFGRLKAWAKETGDEMGLSLGIGATSGLDKLKEAAIAAERTVSDANGRMASSADLLSAAQEKAAATATAAAKAQALYSDALERQNALGVLTLAQTRELDALQAKATATSVAATTASARATSAATAATAAQRSHADASIAAAAASSKFASSSEASAASGLGLVKVLNGVGMGAFLATGAAMAVTTDKAADYQSALVKLKASAHEMGTETTGNLKAVSDGVLALAGTVPYGPQVLMDAMYGIEKAGYRGADGIKVLKSAAQLASIEGADLGNVVSGLTTSLNDFGMNQDQAANVATKLKVAVGMTKGTIDEFTGSLHNVEPAARTFMGTSSAALEQTYVAMARMSQSGESLDQSSQNVRNAIEHMGSMTLGPQRDAISALGLNPDDLAKKMQDPGSPGGGLIGVLNTLSETIRSKLSPSQQVVMSDMMQSSQATETQTKMLAAMSPAAAAAAQALQNHTLSVKDYNTVLKNSDSAAAAQLRSFAQLQTKMDGFSNNIKRNQSDAETVGRVWRDATGTDAGLTVASQLGGTPELLKETTDALKEVHEATAAANGDVSGLADTQDTLNDKLGRTKAAFGAAAIEMGDVFVPAMTHVANGLKDVGNFMKQHETVARDLTYVVGGIGTAWVIAKGIMVFGGAIDNLARLKDAVLGVKGASDLANASLRGAGPAAAEGKVGVVAAEAEEATAVKAVGTTAAGVASSLAFLGVAVGAWMQWGNDKLKDLGQNTENARAFGAQGLAERGLKGPGTSEHDWTGITGGSNGSHGGAGDKLRAAHATSDVTPTPGDISLTAPVSLTPGDGGSGGLNGWDALGGAKKPKGDKIDPIWISAANPDEFKADKDHGITGSSILEGGFDFSPKSIGTFFTALLTDLAMGNPIGKTLAETKLGASRSNPMYITSVDVGRAQSKLDKAIRDNGPDSQEAKTASRELDATRAMVGTTGGYYDPLTGQMGTRANLDENGNYSGGVSGGSFVNPGKGAEGWRSTVAATVAKYGAAAGIPDSQFGNWTDAIVRQIQTESGGNPGADNPNDSNGRGGKQHVSGLLQYLPSTFANSAQKLTGITDMMDPTAQIAGALLAGKNAAGAPTDIGNGVGWGPSRQPVDTSLVRNAPSVTPTPGSASPDSDGSILGNLRSLFTGGGGEGPVFKQSPGAGSGLNPDGSSSTPRPGWTPRNYNGGVAWYPPADAAMPGPFPSPGATGSAPGSVGPFAVPGAVAAAAPGGLGNSARLTPGMGASASRWTSPAPNAAPGSHMAQDGSKPSPGAPPPSSWGSGKGATSSIASSLISAAGPMAAMAPGSAQAAQLADRTIGYVAQVGGIAVEGLMQSLIPTGGGGGIGDPSKSVLGKLAGGIAGAHKSSPNTAGNTAPPGPKPDDDKAKQQPGGDTNHIGTQQSGGINTQGGDVHITAASPQQFASDQPQNQYQFATR